MPLVIAASSPAASGRSKQIPLDEIGVHLLFLVALVHAGVAARLLLKRRATGCDDHRLLSRQRSVGSDVGIRANICPNMACNCRMKRTTCVFELTGASVRVGRQVRARLFIAIARSRHGRVLALSPPLWSSRVIVWEYLARPSAFCRSLFSRCDICDECVNVLVVVFNVHVRVPISRSNGHARTPSQERGAPPPRRRHHPPPSSVVGIGLCPFSRRIGE